MNTSNTYWSLSLVPWEVEVEVEVDVEGFAIGDTIITKAVVGLKKCVAEIGLRSSASIF